MSKNLQRILYIEDDQDIRTITVLVLESMGGFIVEPCSAGAEGLRKVVAFEPDLILMDVMMPGMDGLETLKELRQLPQCKATPVVFMTAKVQPQEVRAYVALGAAGVIAKPFNPITLTQELRTIWTKNCYGSDGPNQ